MMREGLRGIMWTSPGYMSAARPGLAHEVEWRAVGLEWRFSIAPSGGGEQHIAYELYQPGGARTSPVTA